MNLNLHCFQPFICANAHQSKRDQYLPMSWGVSKPFTMHMSHLSGSSHLTTFRSANRRGSPGNWFPEYFQKYIHLLGTATNYNHFDPHENITTTSYYHFPLHSSPNISAGCDPDDIGRKRLACVRLVFVKLGTWPCTERFAFDSFIWATVRGAVEWNVWERRSHTYFGAGTRSHTFLH